MFYYKRIRKYMYNKFVNQYVNIYNLKNIGRGFMRTDKKCLSISSVNESGKGRCAQT
jgi:hypothetical protein